MCEDTPGGIKRLEAFVTAGPAGRTLITMTAPATIDSAELRDLLREHRDEIIEHLDLDVVALLGPTKGG